MEVRVRIEHDRTNNNQQQLSTIQYNDSGIILAAAKGVMVLILGAGFEHPLRTRRYSTGISVTPSSFCPALERRNHQLHINKNDVSYPVISSDIEKINTTLAFFRACKSLICNSATDPLAYETRPQDQTWSPEARAISDHDKLDLLEYE